MVINAKNQAMDIMGTTIAEMSSHSSRDTKNADPPNVKKTNTDKKKVCSADLRCASASLVDSSVILPTRCTNIWAQLYDRGSLAVVPT